MPIEEMKTKKNRREREGISLIVGYDFLFFVLIDAVSNSMDGCLKIWDLQTFELRRTIEVSFGR